MDQTPGKEQKKKLLKGYLWLLGRLLLVALVAWLVLTQVFLLMQAPDNGMFPAVKAGDLLVGFRLQQDYRKNDVVVFQLGDETQVGRILGCGGDVVNIDQAGTLTVNGTVQSGEILFPTDPGTAVEYPCTIPEDCVFLLGDYRTKTKDSRSFGCIPRECVKAKVITLLRRRSI